ncbi:MAG: TetR/AcrR family transcriptional regulator [Mogibacterium sp.]|nr:TetR/AcrR family transcriptional regulator [Mogibacterium sp.]
MSKTSKATRNRIVNTAWKLFYEQGYDDTTIDDIIEAAHISRGSFYHYFDGKDALIGGITYLFDDAYDEICAHLDSNLSPIEKLLTLTQESFFMIENTVPVHLLSKIMSSQLAGSSDSSLLNPDRTYFKVIRQIVTEGKEKQVFKESYSVNEIVVAYALFERGLMYDWCISNGNYSFSRYSRNMMKIFLTGFTVV